MPRVTFVFPDGVERGQGVFWVPTVGEHVTFEGDIYVPKEHRRNYQVTKVQHFIDHPDVHYAKIHLSEATP